MITMPLAGCFGGDDSSDASDEALDDWNVHFAATAADLPTCDEDTNGRLYYVEADNQFQVCKTTGWEIIDIRGADGADGEPGKTGRDGSPGRDVDQSIIANYENQLSLQNATIASLEYNISKLQSDKVRLENDLNQAENDLNQVENDLNQAENDLYTVIASLQSQIISLNLNATTCQLVPYADCAGADLSGMDMSGMNLTGINLQNAILENANFDNAILEGSNLRGIIANNATFRNAQMSYVQLNGADFWDSQSCPVKGKGANFSGAIISYSDLTNANLYCADLTSASLWGSNLNSINLERTWLRWSYLHDANMFHASLVDALCQGTFFDDSDFTNARFVGSNCDNGYFNNGNTWRHTLWIDGNYYDSRPSNA